MSPSVVKLKPYQKGRRQHSLSQCHLCDDQVQDLVAHGVHLDKQPDGHPDDGAQPGQGTCATDLWWELPSATGAHVSLVKEMQGACLVCMLAA